ncbi:efflux RND transporter periplasmic adaptor subunit [Helicobacter sp. 23-1048]
MEAYYNKSKILFFGVLALLFLACGSEEDGNKKPQVPVSVITIKEQNTPLEFEYPARLKSVQSANVYARVEGILLSQNFKEGDIIQEGQPLFQIDPKRYQARVTMARAQYDTARANFSKSKKDWERTERLYKQGALTVDAYDNALYNYQSAQANVDSAKASLDDALIDLDYTNVVASFTGRVGMRRYDVGNLVGKGNDSILTTLTQLSPIYAEFAIPSNDFYYMRNLRDENMIVEAIMGNGVVYEKKGKIDFIDSVLDSQTSSVKARAIFDNESFVLVPNEFMRVNIKGFQAQNAIAIPQSAILQDSVGSYVYVVRDGKASIARVSLGKSLKNGLVLVPSGLQTGDTLITTNLTKLSQDTPVATSAQNALQVSVSKEKSE